MLFAEPLVLMLFAEPLIVGRVQQAGNEMLACAVRCITGMTHPGYVTFGQSPDGNAFPPC